MHYGIKFLNFIKLRLQWRLCQLCVFYKIDANLAVGKWDMMDQSKQGQGTLPKWQGICLGIGAIQGTGRFRIYLVKGAHIGLR